MPKSKHRKKHSKRTAQQAPQQPKARRTPKWVPYLGVGLIGVATLVVIVAYVTALGDWLVLLGFAGMAAGLVTLSQAR